MSVVFLYASHENKMWPLQVLSVQAAHTKASCFIELNPSANVDAVFMQCLLPAPSYFSSLCIVSSFSLRLFLSGGFFLYGSGRAKYGRSENASECKKISTSVGPVGCFAVSHTSK